MKWTDRDDENDEDSRDLDSICSEIVGLIKAARLERSCDPAGKKGFKPPTLWSRTRDLAL
jgi:hypothetical protein